MDPVLYLLAAVVAGAVVQNFMTFRQATAFSRDVHALRTPGRTTSIGVGGRRYRGGRAYVAIAVDEQGVVRGALTLKGFTTFARATPLPEVIGRKAAGLAHADEDGRGVPGLSKQQNAGLAQAAEILRQTLERHAAKAAAAAATAQQTPDRTTSGSRKETAV